MSSSNNLENKNATFLNKSNSGFIEEMYVKFIEGDPNLPESWRSYFESLNEDLEVISKEIQGPNWSPKKIKINRNNLSYKNNIPREHVNVDKKVYKLSFVPVFDLSFEENLTRRSNLFVNYLANPDKVYGSRLDPSFDFKGRATLRLNSMLTISSTDNILSSDIAISAEKSSDRYSSYSLSLSLDYKF